MTLSSDPLDPVQREITLLPIYDAERNVIKIHASLNVKFRNVPIGRRFEADIMSGQTILLGVEHDPALTVQRTTDDRLPVWILLKATAFVPSDEERKRR